MLDACKCHVKVAALNSLSPIYLSVFDHFVGLAFNGLKSLKNDDTFVNICNLLMKWSISARIGDHIFSMPTVDNFLYKIFVQFPLMIIHISLGNYVRVNSTNRMP